MSLHERSIRLLRFSDSDEELFVMYERYQGCSSNILVLLLAQQSSALCPALHVSRSRHVLNADVL